MAAQNLQPHLQPDECGDCLGVSQVSHSVTFPIWPKGKKERRVEKTTQSDKVTLTQLSARSSRCERRGRGTRGGRRAVAIDRNRIHTAPSIYWRIIIATAKARATVVAGDASGGRGGHRGVEWLPADCQDRNSTTGLQNPIPRDRGSSKSQT